MAEKGKFKWANRVGFPMEAKVAGEYLEKLEEEHSGLTAKIVVDDARPVGSLLHPCFEWNDTKAAEEYRMEQARLLMRSIKVVTHIKKGKEEIINEVRLIHHVKRNKDEESKYHTIYKIAEDPNSYESILGRAYEELLAWERKYEGLLEFQGIYTSIKKVKTKIRKAVGA